MLAPTHPDFVISVEWQVEINALVAVDPIQHHIARRGEVHKLALHDVKGYLEGGGRRLIGYQ